MILRQGRGLDPAAGLLVAVAALVVLFFARGSVAWPCCRPSAVCSCRLPPVRIAAGVVVGALVGLVAFKEQGGRVALGPGGPAWRRACCPPGRADLGRGCSTWCRAWFQIAGGVAGVRLVLAG